MAIWKGIILAGRGGHPSPSSDFERQQAASAGLQQAHDLLSPVRAHAGGHSGDRHRHHTDDEWQFRKLFGDGSQWGCSFEYVIQPKPEGIAQAFLLAADFIRGCNVCLILGDNIFFGNGLEELLLRAKNREAGASVFAYHVSDPERYGVVEFDRNMQVLSLEEKPSGRSPAMP